ELYDLENDPGELKNLVDAEPAKARVMRASLEERLRVEQSAGRPDAASAGVPRDQLERLGALGYVGPGRPVPPKSSVADMKKADARGTKADAHPADPKD